METENNKKSEAKEILDQQMQLRLAREKISPLLNKNIHIISGDLGIRGTLKGYFETLGFSASKIKTNNSSAEVLSHIDDGKESVDLIICHLNILDRRYSTQTGFHLLKIVKDKILQYGIETKIPFLFMEKTFEKTDIISAFKAGATQFLVLPSDPVSLADKMTEVFSLPQKSAVSQEVTNHLLEGNKLQEQGLYEAAIVQYNKALEIGGESAEILNEKANTLLKSGDIEQAITLYKRVVEIEVSFPRAYQGLGSAYEQIGNFEAAKKNYAKVLDLEPQNVQVNHQLGVLHQGEGDYEQAQKYFEQGIDLNKKFVKNYLSLAKNYEAQENVKQSLKIYKKAMQDNPNQTFLFVTAGDFCLKHDMNQDAEEIFNEAITQNETHIHLYNRMGIALRKQRKFDEAITNYAKAIKINPDDANLRYNLAKAYYIKGEELTALDKLLKALQLDPELREKFEKDKYFSKLLEKYPEKFNL